VGGSQPIPRFVDNGFGYTVWIPHDIGIPEADDFPSQAFQESRPRNVRFVVDVLTAIYFNGELQLPAGQVHDVASDRQLSCEAGSKMRHADPDQTLRFGWIVAELAGSLSHEWRHARH